MHLSTYSFLFLLSPHIDVFIFYVFNFFYFIYLLCLFIYSFFCSKVMGTLVVILEWQWMSVVKKVEGGVFDAVG